MSATLNAFLSENAKQIENEKIIVSKRFLDEKNAPVPFEIKAISNAEDEILRKESAKRVQVKKGQFQNETDYDVYLGKLAAQATVFPNLNDAKLQDSYGVKSSDALLKTMLTPGEYSKYIIKVQEHSGFETFEDLVDEAKN